ncbi:MAG: antibiotic biosynthesis monooxygenase family protein [Candidatus Nanopelagicales bacterium]
MITETAYFTIQPGREEDFELALNEARQLVESTPGCRGLTVLRGVERPSVYLVAIGWNSLDDHLVGFRESDRFGRWRDLLGPFFAEPPQVEHFEMTQARFTPSS